MKKILSYLLLFLIFVLLLMVVSAGAQTTRIKLVQIEKSNTVNGTKANQLPLSNGVGDLRYAQYTEINPTPIGYTPALTGNPAANYAQFVKPANGDVWYIDNEGRGIRLYVAANAGDYDWLEIGNNQIPNSITDSIYKYKYASVGGRYVWPTAEMLVIDSVAQGMFIVAGDRKAKVALYDTNNQTWSTWEQGGGTTSLIMQSGGTFAIQTAGSGTPQAPGTPITDMLVINGDSSIQFPQYPSSRTDPGTPTKLWGPDATGKMKCFPVSSIPANGITELTGDVTATGPGSAVATIANLAVTGAKLATNSVDSNKIAIGSVGASDLSTVPLQKLQQRGATNGQILKWNGSSWIPANDSLSAIPSYLPTYPAIPQGVVPTSPQANNNQFLVYASGIMRPGGTISNGSPITWTILGNSDSHASAFYDTVYGGNAALTVGFPTVKRVVSSHVTPDETLALAGIFCGPSVGLNNLFINIARSAQYGVRLTGTGTSSWTLSSSANITLAPISSGNTSINLGTNAINYESVCINYVGANPYRIRRNLTALGSFNLGFSLVNTMTNQVVTSNPTSSDVVTISAYQAPTVIGTLTYSTTTSPSDNTYFTSSANFWVSSWFEAWIVARLNSNGDPVVSWQTNYPSATSYKIKRATTKYGAQTLVYTGTSGQITDTGLSAGTYFYQLYATVSGVDTFVSYFTIRKY